MNESTGFVDHNTVCSIAFQIELHKINLIQTVILSIDRIGWKAPPLLGEAQWVPVQNRAISLLCLIGIIQNRREKMWVK